MSTGRESDKFMLRLPDGMRELIKGSADARGRSMNAEIVQRLQDSFASESAREMEDEAAVFEKGMLEMRLQDALYRRFLYEIGSDLSADGLRKIIDAVKLDK